MTRIEFGACRASLNLPRLMVLVDGDDGSCAVVALHYGNGSSDPVFYAELVLSNTRLGKRLSLAYWWIREHRRNPTHALTGKSS